MNPYQEAEVYEKHDGIKCLTCKCRVYRKTDCAKHQGHEVVYVDKNGEPIK